MGRIAGFPGDSKRKRGDTAEKSGDLPEKLNRVRSLSLFGGGIQREPRVIRGALISHYWPDSESEYRFDIKEAKKIIAKRDINEEQPAS